MTDSQPAGQQLPSQLTSDNAGEIRQSIDSLKATIADLRQQLAAERARAEQAEAACGAFREAITSKHDTPSSLIEGLQAYAMRTHNAEKAWHTTIADKLEAALASDDGKSAAEEIRRLRELLAEVYRQAGNGAAPSRRHALTPGLRDSIRDVIYPKQGALIYLAHHDND